MKRCKRLVRDSAIVAMLLPIAILSTPIPSQAFRPVRNCEVKTSPIQIGELFRISSVIEATKLEDWDERELPVICAIKLRKFGINTVVMVTNEGHYFFLTDNFLADCSPKLLEEDVLKGAEYLFEFIDEGINDPAYENSRELSDKEEQLIVDYIIETHTSPLEYKIVNCLKCDYPMLVPKDSPERRLCGFHITADLFEGDYRLPDIWKIELREVMDGVAEYRTMRSSP